MGRVLTDRAGGLLVAFEGDLPPPNTDLTILAAPEPVRPPRAGVGTVCFTPGTRIRTPAGSSPVEDLYPGDVVLTRDDGPQPIEWMALKHVSGARLYAMPQMRPVRIRTGALEADTPRPDLVVSPDHRVLLEGDAARRLWGEPEVLARAADLVGEPGIARDHAAGEAVYIHMLLGRHHVVWANEVPCETFHPADAELSQLSEVDREDLLAAVPGIDRLPDRYGPHARRCVTPADLALMRHRGAPAWLG